MNRVVGNGRGVLAHHPHGEDGHFLPVHVPEAGHVLQAILTGARHGGGGASWRKVSEGRTGGSDVQDRGRDFELEG